MIWIEKIACETVDFIIMALWYWSCCQNDNCYVRV